ncbi:hypothetical protein FK85_07330 [Halorubrum saccharovorum]|uniref:Uncharacterized protein n=1 Tax=Halorubrum saccharovorum TaxID=2248 RepID=A0A081EXG0_9EURY|nr:hypothetical protein FK85_07330 [Halorubrum saccharovorum]
MLTHILIRIFVRHVLDSHPERVIHTFGSVLRLSMIGHMEKLIVMPLRMCYKRVAYHRYPQIFTYTTRSSTKSKSELL